MQLPCRTPGGEGGRKPGKYRENPKWARLRSQSPRRQVHPRGVESWSSPRRSQKPDKVLSTPTPDSSVDGFGGQKRWFTSTALQTQSPSTRSVRCTGWEPGGRSPEPPPVSTGESARASSRPRQEA